MLIILYYIILLKLFYLKMPRKLKNGQLEFKRGCIGETDGKGNYKVVAARKRRKTRKTKKKVEKKENNEVTPEVQIEKKEKIARRSQKKQFSKQTNKQTGGNYSPLEINIHMLRDFYSKNY